MLLPFPLICFSYRTANCLQNQWQFRLRTPSTYWLFMFLDEGLIAKMRGLQDYKITVFLLLAVSPLWRGYLNRPARVCFFMSIRSNNLARWQRAKRSFTKCLSAGERTFSRSRAVLLLGSNSGAAAFIAPYCNRLAAIIIVRLEQPQAFVQTHPSTNLVQSCKIQYHVAAFLRR